MSRATEYRALLAELEQTPPALEYTVQRALTRKKTLQKKRRLLEIPMGSAAVCFTVFVLLVNLFPPFAAACGRLPVLRELALAVAWSPSLSAAVENEYVQPIGQSQTVNGITAKIEYVIVDQKQVNIFFTLEGEGYESFSAQMPDFSPDQHCFIRGSDFSRAPGMLLYFTLDYSDRDVPEGFTMTFAVTGERKGEQEGQQELQTAPDRVYEDELLNPSPQPEPEILAEFTFDLEFDPRFTDQGEIIPVNETFCMDGQTFTVTEAEIYPTQVRLNVEADPSNTAWLRGLDFCLENEDEERFDSVANGVSGTGDPDSPAMVSFRLESPYFSGSDRLTLFITGAQWLDKDHERVWVDLEHETAPWLPEGVTLSSAQLREGGWFLTFRIAPTGRPAGSPFSMTFYDPEGNRWQTGQMGYTASGDDQESQLMLPLPDYRENGVWLEAYYSHATTADAPIVIPLK